jgi:hypothetical protein
MKDNKGRTPTTNTRTTTTRGPSTCLYRCEQLLAGWIVGANGCIIMNSERWGKGEWAMMVMGVTVLWQQQVNGGMMMGQQEGDFFCYFQYIL